MEQAEDRWVNERFVKAGLAAGTITEADIDDSVSRILWSMFSVGVMDEPATTWDWGKLKNNVTTEIPSQETRRLAAVSTVLLKNDGGLLPLKQGLRIAVVG